MLMRKSANTLVLWSTKKIWRLEKQNGFETKGRKRLK